MAPRVTVAASDTCLDSPRQPIVWDTGHQCCAHRMLTGRAHRFDTLRTAGAPSGNGCRPAGSASAETDDWLAWGALRR